MIFFIGLLGVPIAYLVVLAWLLFRRDSRGVGMSLLFAVVAAGTGVWSITQSRSSTAGIGFLGIPMLFALAGFLGLLFARYRLSPQPAQKYLAWAALVAAVVLVSFNMAEGEKTRAKNTVSDKAQDAHTAQITSNREVIEAALEENRGRQRVWLDSSIRANMNDRAFLLAALPHDSISPDLLNVLAESPDLGIALEAVRNPSTPSEALERVYRTRSYPDYFFQALAANHHTPPTVLREIYRKPGTSGGLEIWFASNPSTPREILDPIARTSKDRSVIASLLENPALTCPTLTALAMNLMKDQNRDAEDPNVARLNELLPSTCPHATK
ncbi:MAG TPA: hypothetical protein VLJ83_05725 [Gemmatimonadaceae bacterium]|nr:hypothetical protein [Gemmatimonadaceae bacterium]